MYDTYQRRITECDQQLQNIWRVFPRLFCPRRRKRNPREKGANQPRTHLNSSSVANCNALQVSI